MQQKIRIVDLGKLSREIAIKRKLDVTKSNVTNKTNKKQPHKEI